MAEKLEIALLGNPELHLAGQPMAKFRSAKVYALLYYLAVTRRAQPRSVLAGLFWGEIGEYYARRNFSRTLSDLAQYVGDHLLIERQTVAFDRQQPYWLDIEVLENAADCPPTAQNVAALAAAAERYRGDFLDGFVVQEAPEFDQWLLSERTRLRTCALQLHETLSRYYAEQGELTQAMNYARRILQLEPWREEAHRQLMLLLAQSGQRSAALAQYELCRQALSSELNVEPSSATLDLFSHIRAGKIDKAPEEKPVVAISAPLPPVSIAATAPTPSVIRHNLPSQRTTFVGRAAELSDITRLLIEEEECRLLTLVGPGGMGKTRLALKTAEQIAALSTPRHRFADGVLFVPLENVIDQDGLVAALLSVIAEESGFPRHSDAPLQQQLFQSLHAKSMLLVLDNFEHLVKQAELLSALLTAAPRIKLLVTSRETLGLQEAWFYPLLGLSIPNSSVPTRAAQGDDDAVRLFVQCARRVRADFILDTERAAVLRICTLVEGMPLGIELAAAWLKVMSCDQIAQEVARGLDFLTARYQNIPARHRSMRAVMEHSWALLAVKERAIAARLSVFCGPFSHEAAEIVGASLLTLADLVEKALLRLRPDGTYQMHELTRQFAEEQLGPAQALYSAHAQYYAELAQRLVGELYGPQSKATLGQLNLIIDNMHSAWQWLLQTLEQGKHHPLAAQWLAQLIAPLAEYFYIQARFQEGVQIFQQAAARLQRLQWEGSASHNATVPQSAPAPLRTVYAQLHVRIGMLSYDIGRYEAVQHHIEAALPILHTWGNAEELAQAYGMLGKAHYRRGQRSEAYANLYRSLEYANTTPNLLWRAVAFNNLSHLAEDDGDFAETERLLRQCLAIYEKMNSAFNVGTTLGNLGFVYILWGRYEEAVHYLQRSLVIAEQEGDPVSTLINLNHIADAQRAQCDLQGALDGYQRSMRLAQQIGHLRGMVMNLNGLAQTYLDLDDFAAATPRLTEAWVIARKTASVPDVLLTMGSLARLWGQQGRMLEALRMLAVVVKHPALTAWMKPTIQRLFDRLAQDTPPALVSQVKEWAANQTLEGMLPWVDSLIRYDSPSPLPV
ncbi:MAG: BTAD domain-containing putative transcriptional regulator [Caldilineaceae bacterium]